MIELRLLGLLILILVVSIHFASLPRHHEYSRVAVKCGMP